MSKELTPYDQKVLNYFRTHALGEQTFQQIADHFGVTRKSICKLRMRLVMHGHLPIPGTEKFITRSYKQIANPPPIPKNLLLMDEMCATPTAVTKALLRNEAFEGIVWDPASGSGALSKLLEEKFGVERVRATDRLAGVSFLNTRLEHVDNIVVHPPYLKAKSFLRRALAVAEKKAALFLPLKFLPEAREQRTRGFQLKAVHVISNVKTLRPMWSKDAPNYAILPMAWFVWEKGYHGMERVNWVDSKK